MNRAPGTTEAERAALDWLEKHGGDGVFAEHNRIVLHASGDRAPFNRSTWNRLKALGYVEFYGQRRARLVPGYQPDPLKIAALNSHRPVVLG